MRKVRDVRAWLNMRTSDSLVPRRETARELQCESYVEQRDGVWPKAGRHILAQYDEESVVVYQAFCPEIAEYAVRNQK